MSYKGSKWQKTIHGIDTSTAKHMTGRDYARELVRVRDNHQCQSCKRPWNPKTDKKRLDIHHLDGLCGKKSKRADSVRNLDRLVTLCHKCHYNHHEFSKRLTGEWLIKT